MNAALTARVNKNRLVYELSNNGKTLPAEVRKRDGSVARFDMSRVERAVTRCYANLEIPPTTPVDVIVRQVSFALAARYGSIDKPSVEIIQDLVEYALQSAGEFDAAKSYILYRERHAEDRKRVIPDEVVSAFVRDTAYFPTAAQQFMFYDKYSRYNHDLGRRETWVETVKRSVDYLRELSNNQLDPEIYADIYRGILNMEVMPSMRLLAMAGPAARRNSLAIYNCSYLPVCDIQSFVEALLISMAGCGVGFSVESHYVEQFPRIKRQKRNFEAPTHWVEDSSEGWGEALRVGVTAWWNGEDVKFAYDLVRPAGMPLLTKGGRSSGPEPLRQMLDFLKAKVLSRQGSFLRPIDAHDMMCAVGQGAVSGGTRRTAMISLFDWEDHEMRRCKDGGLLDANPLRWNANNSVVWPENISQIDLIKQMVDMAEGRRGEPGIFSRENAVATRPKRRKKARFGTNPCGEINLRPFGLCNLSIAVARSDDTPETLRRKVELATIIGTIQSLATNFPGMRPEWAQNCDEERLLGVDITGQMDAPVIQDGDLMEELAGYAVSVNEDYAAQLGINPAAAVTCNKPSGNSSQLLNCSSGIHARHAEYYVRNMRVSAMSPIYKVLRDAGVPMSPENGQTVTDAITWVVHFPIKAPDGAVLRAGRTAIEQLDYWLLCKTRWTEHNPSATITYGPEELADVITWLWDHRDQVGGLSFLPVDDAQYSQMPYEEIDAETYERLAGEFPPIDFSKVFRYEVDDMTTASSELACFAGTGCEV